MLSIFFAENFNDVLHLVSKEASSKTVKLVEFRQSLNKKLISNANQKTKCSSAVISDSFPSKNLHPCRQFFASIFFSFFASIVLTSYFLEVSGSVRVLIRCSSLESKLILPTIGL